MNHDDMKNNIRIETLEIFSQPSPVKQRGNEDAWLAVQSPFSPEIILLAVIDGAGVRKPLPSLVNYLQNYYPSLTPAAFSANIVKQELISQMRRKPENSLYDYLINANIVLRNTIEKIIGSFDSVKFLAELDDTFRSEDRNIRLVLPACAATLARFNTKTFQVEFAHVGDTSLLEVSVDRNVILHTNDQMRRFDVRAFEDILQLQKRLGLPHFKDAVQLPEGRHYIIESGLHLNFVDDLGMTDLAQGCGVLNGLPEMKDYIESGMINIDDKQNSSFILLSDGLELLSPLHEETSKQIKRFNQTAEIVQKFGLRGLYNKISKMTESDSYFDRYPRTKMQDDATGIYIQFR